MSHVLQCVWPVIDDMCTLRQLIAEAGDGLEHLAEQAHAVITGPPLWELRDAAETPGWTAYDGCVLVATMPAMATMPAISESVGLVDVVAEREARDGRVRELHALGLSDREIGVRVGLSTPGVQYVRGRLGLSANFAPGSHRRRAA